MCEGGKSGSFPSVRKGTQSRRITICILSPHPLVLDGFQKLLSRPDFRLLTRVLESTLLSDLRRLHLPRATVYLVDAHLPRPVTEALLETILNQYPRARPLVVAERFNETNTFPLLRLGAKGLMRYADADKQLSRAVEAVAGRGFWVPRTLLSRFVDSMLRSLQGRRWASTSAHLSQREQEVLDAVVKNLSNKEIAARFNISERTAKYHVSNLLAKFDVRRRHDLILQCLQTRSPGT